MKVRGYRKVEGEGLSQAAVSATLGWNKTRIPKRVGALLGVLSVICPLQASVLSEPTVRLPAAAGFFLGPKSRGRSPQSQTRQPRRTWSESSFSLL